MGRLELFARRISKNPQFLGNLLLQIQKERDWSDDELAAYLEMSKERLPLLLLCRMPRATPEELFFADVTSIAEFIGLNSEKLAILLSD